MNNNKKEVNVCHHLSIEDGWGPRVKISELGFWSGETGHCGCAWAEVSTRQGSLAFQLQLWAWLLLVLDRVTGSGSLTLEAGIGCRSDQVLSVFSHQPDFWGTDSCNWHYWCHPGGRGLEKVQEGEPQG